MSKQIDISGSEFPAVVDDEDYPVLSRLSWHLDKDGYVGHDFHHGHKSFIKVHELLIPAKPGYEIQYINRNRLDLRKQNLVMATRSRNVVMSRKTQKKTTSIYRGVHWNKHAKLWCSRAKKDNKTIYCGYFHSEKDAAVAYLEAIREHHNLDLTLEQITRKAGHDQSQ